MTRLPSPIYLDEPGQGMDGNRVLPRQPKLIAAILLITANDISRLIQGRSPLGG